jgi:hypothetical protein
VKLQIQVNGVGAGVSSQAVARVREAAARRSLARRREEARRRFLMVFGARAPQREDE